MTTTATKKPVLAQVATTTGNDFANEVTTWTVTNNSGIDLIVLDAYLSDPSATDELYQCSLQVLLTTDGQNSIKAGSSKTIAVGAAHTDADGNDVDYSIIIARADNLFPVKLVELAVSNNPSVFAAVTVTAADAKLMRNAEAFQQAITAFPSSQMATAFATVLPANNEQQMAAFFKSYPQYGALTLDEVAAVQTYYNRYGFVWAGYAATQAFDIYTSADGTTKKNLGTVTITNNVVSTITNLNAPAGFTATYMDANHRKTTLYYTNGQFSEDTASSTPKICLQGLFILLSQLSGEVTDNRIVPVLYGKVNGAKVFGVSSNYPAVNTMNIELMSTASTTTDIKNYFDSLGLYGWLKLAGIVVGAIAGVVVLCVTVRCIYKRVKRALLTPDEIRSLNQQKVAKALERMADAGVAIPDDLTKALSDIKAEANLNLLTDTKAKVERILSKQRAACEKLMEYGRTNSLQEAWTKTNDLIEHELPFVDPENLPEQMKAINERIGKNTGLVTDRCNSLGTEIKGANAEIISEARSTAERLTKSVKTNEEIRKDLIDDEIPEIVED